MSKRKKKKSEADIILDELVDRYLSEHEASGEGVDELRAKGLGLFDAIKKRFYERALQAEMDNHLGYKKGERPGESPSNVRNGSSTKRVATSDSHLEIEVPRDRASEFDPIIIEKHARRLPDFDEKVIYLYAQGVSQRDIKEQLEDFYGITVSQELISEVTDEVIEDVREWRNRRLDAVYPIVYLDALVAKVRGPEGVTNRAVYVALGVNLQGKKEVLGLWLGENEGAKFWLRVLTEIKNRGVEDIFIACIDGLSGFAEAIESEFPRTRIQGCIVHAIRNSLKFTNWKQRKEVAADLKLIYTAATLEQGELELQKFRDKWDGTHPMIGDFWQRHWDRLSVLFSYPKEIRRAIYTTNAIESLNHSLRKVLKNRKAFTTEDSLMKVLYLAIGRASKKWTMPIRNWGAALQRFAIEFGNRVPKINDINL